MTCKDCIHRELCAEYVLALAKIQNADVEYISQWLDEIEGKRDQADNGCEHFKDRSRFVELPCEAFTIVFGKVSAGRIDSANILLKNSTAWTFDSSHIGKEIFFTREEAEQALKEREGNGKL